MTQPTSNHTPIDAFNQKIHASSSQPPPLSKQDQSVKSVGSSIILKNQTEAQAKQQFSLSSNTPADLDKSVKKTNGIAQDQLFESQEVEAGDLEMDDLFSQEKVSDDIESPIENGNLSDDDLFSDISAKERESVEEGTQEDALSEEDLFSETPIKDKLSESSQVQKTTAQVIQEKYVNSKSEISNLLKNEIVRGLFTEDEIPTTDVNKAAFMITNKDNVIVFNANKDKVSILIHQDPAKYGIKDPSKITMYVIDDSLKEFFLIELSIALKANAPPTVIEKEKPKIKRDETTAHSRVKEKTETSKQEVKKAEQKKESTLAVLQKALSEKFAEDQAATQRKRAKKDSDERDKNQRIEHKRLAKEADKTEDLDVETKKKEKIQRDIKKQKEV